MSETLPFFATELKNMGVSLYKIHPIKDRLLRLGGGDEEFCRKKFLQFVKENNINSVFHYDHLDLSTPTVKLDQETYVAIADSVKLAITVKHE